LRLIADIGKIAEVDPIQTSQYLTRTGQQTIFVAGRYDLLLAPFGVR
jgi:hypothetical protein